MKLTDKIGHDIFINFDSDEEGLNKFLSRYGIEIIWLFEDGVRFRYPDDLITKDYPGNLSFYDPTTNSLILTYLENFGALEFIDADENLLYSIELNE